MTRAEHHKYCLGTMALIYHGKLKPDEVKVAVEQAVESAQALGLPVSLQLLRAGKPISTEPPPKEKKAKI